MKLLVSVESLEEARVAAEANCAVLDINIRGGTSLFCNVTGPIGFSQSIPNQCRLSP